jgi:hypothetical protein
MKNNNKLTKPYRFIMNLTCAEKRWLKEETKKQNTSMATLIRRALSHYRMVLDDEATNDE